MRFIITDPRKNRNVTSLLRQAGYHLEGERRENEFSFYHSFSSGSFPRFHLYLKEAEGGWEANLHLDQKRPSYQGSHAHSGEYDGEIVEKEVRRLGKLLTG